ncbi:MAG: response regulator [Micavibrio sp.]|nr:MAG: response regulator [Micavibrio sp.]
MSYHLQNVHVLVAESTPPMFQLVRGVLALLGIPPANIDSAYTAEEAFRKFCRRNHDLVIVDWLSESGEGLKLVRSIRINPQSPNPFVPVLMTAGSGHLRRVRRSRDCGVSDYLVKPFSANDLAQRIERIIEKPRPFVYYVEESGAPGYVGPDRRRKSKSYDGQDRRLAASPTTADAQIEFSKSG